MKALFFFVALTTLVTLTSCGRGTAVGTNAVASENQTLVRGKTTVVALPNSGLYAQVTFNDFPAPVVTTTSLSLRFWNADLGSPQTGPFIDPGFDLSHPNIKLWMIMKDGFSHGTKELAPKKVETTVGGVKEISFTLENAYFSMEGTWQVQMEFKRAGVLIDKAVLVYEVPVP